MPIEPKDITDGYWYVKSNADPSGHSIVRVFQGSVLICDYGCDHGIPIEHYTFIGPVPAVTEVADVSPDAAREELVKLRQELNLPVHASVTEVFRAALALARQTAAEVREKNP